MLGLSYAGDEAPFFSAFTNIVTPNPHSSIKNRTIILSLYYNVHVEKGKTHKNELYPVWHGLLN